MVCSSRPEFVFDPYLLINTPLTAHISIQMLSEMDGFDAESGVIVMAATNRKDVLDPALVRPGRFDRIIYIGRPDFNGRIEILEVRPTDFRVL